MEHLESPAAISKVGTVDDVLAAIQAGRRIATTAHGKPAPTNTRSAAGAIEDLSPHPVERVLRLGEVRAHEDDQISKKAQYVLNDAEASARISEYNYAKAEAAAQEKTQPPQAQSRSWRNFKC